MLRICFLTSENPRITDDFVARRDHYLASLNWWLGPMGSPTLKN